MDYFTTNACETVSLSSEVAIYELPNFENPAKIKYLDLRNANLPEWNLNSFTSLEELHLGSSACPINLPNSLQKLYLNIISYPFVKFELQFGFVAHLQVKIWSFSFFC